MASHKNAEEMKVKRSYECNRNKTWFSLGFNIITFQITSEMNVRVARQEYNEFRSADLKVIKNPQPSKFLTI